MKIFWLSLPFIVVTIAIILWMVFALGNSLVNTLKILGMTYILIGLIVAFVTYCVIKAEDSK